MGTTRTVKNTIAAYVGEIPGDSTYLQSMMSLLSYLCVGTTSRRSATADIKAVQSSSDPIPKKNQNPK